MIDPRTQLHRLRTVGRRSIGRLGPRYFIVSQRDYSRSSPPSFNLQVRRNARQIRAHVLLMDMKILNAQLIPAFKSHRPPNPLSKKARPPIPSVVVRSLARIGRSRNILFVSVIVRRDRRQNVRQGLHIRQHLLHRRMKNNSQRIRTRVQPTLRRNPPAPEHIIRMQNRLIIEINVRKRIQSLEHQIDMLAPKRRRIHLKRRLIFPVRQPNPLQMKLVIFVKRIRNQLAALQIRLHHPRNLRRMPFLHISPIHIRHRPKLPARIQIPRRSLRRNQREHTESKNHQQSSPNHSHISQLLIHLRIHNTRIASTARRPGQLEQGTELVSPPPARALPLHPRCGSRASPSAAGCPRQKLRRQQSWGNRARHKYFRARPPRTSQSAAAIRRTPHSLCDKEEKAMCSEPLPGRPQSDTRRWVRKPGIHREPERKSGSPAWSYPDSALPWLVSKLQSRPSSSQSARSRPSPCCARISL